MIDSDIQDPPAVHALIDAVLMREGGYVDHPADRGGPTKYGITLATLSAYLGRPVTRARIQALELELAREIYAQRFYYAPRLDRLPGPLQPFLFDCAVNHGPGRAIRLLQSVCNQAGFGPIEEDGVAGPATRRTAQAALTAMGMTLLAALVEERRNLYRRIVAHDSGQKVFLKGWLARAEEFWPKEDIYGLVG